MKKSQFRNYVENFEFRDLFIDLGWNHSGGDPHPVRTGEQLFYLTPKAEKEGFQILLCNPDDEGKIPDYATRKKLETQVTKLYREHLLIFTDEEDTEQLWQWMIRKPNQPARLSDTRWRKGQSPELLYQKTSRLFFSLDEEDNITIVDVKERVSKSFDKNNEKVTKKFYSDFKKQHTKFLKFIDGIDKKVDREWYASLMLNRLMFCYFIQKKGFLDGDLDYLQHKLKACKAKKGEDEFYNFYRDFLLALFHDGLGKPIKSQSTDVELGNIPYLNGGLFDEHDLEKSYEIDIEDDAFQKIFNFFDKYEWHLDTSHGATGKEINPDVIGYIFEKYINDRADMGAYYTKEDITDYISKNTILPYLFDETERHYAEAFSTDSRIWTMLKESGETYIYDAVKFGLPRDEESGKVKNWKHTENWWESPVFDDLPDEIKTGLNPNQADLVEIREAWNTSAPNEAALPTEIWREVIERRKRYVEVRQTIENGEISTINDLITYNLNIRQFVQDVVMNTNDPKFILHFYKSMAGDGENRHPVSVLDPTCGSGAFLFAALNILEPLYESCLQRMRSFVEDEDRLNAEDKETFRHKYKFFREVLEDVQSDYHPNQEYFIYKSIILRNLYGVDIMREAVEIAKLRLFLKMVATVDVDTSKENLGLEPLPDIDFNIRAGNTLVGIGTEEEIDTLFDGFIDFDNTKEAVEEKSDMVAKAYGHFKKIQLTYGEDFESFKQAKQDLANRLSDLRDKLDQMLKKRHYPGKDLEAWKESHQPFHWYAEFYDIIHDCGGFDVLIGNPPYVEYSKVKKEYTVFNYNTESCSNLYAFTYERCKKISNSRSTFGMIIPISSVSTSRMDNLYKNYIYKNRISWNSFFSERPDKLFTGAEVQLLINISKRDEHEVCYSTSCNKWESEFRDYLFSTISYVKNRYYGELGIPKIGTRIDLRILEKLNVYSKGIETFSTSKTDHFLTYRNAGGRYYKIILNFEPVFKFNDEVRISSTYQFYYFKNKKLADALCALMSSTTFFWFWLLYSDTWHMIKRDINLFPIKSDDSLFTDLSNLNDKLMRDLQSNSTKRIENRNKRRDTVEFTQYNSRNSKKIIDKIDKILAVHYKFDSEELDYIINYDIKYRMGSELEDE